MSKRLGQHFLNNVAALKKIARALDVQPGETIIEIGPGHGELTKELQMANGKWQTGLRIIAIEKDRKLAEGLRRKFAEDESVEIVEGDALTLLPKICSDLRISRFKIASNIPYYITGRLFRTIGETEPKPERCVLTVQKEVAERLVAKPRRMNPPHKSMWGMNRLAASVQFWAEPEILAVLPKTDFRPVPKVDSAIVTLKTKEKPAINPSDYYRMVRVIFRQPRKTLSNNLLEAGFGREEIRKSLDRINLNPNLRPQDLGIPDILRIVDDFRGL